MIAEPHQNKLSLILLPALGLKSLYAMSFCVGNGSLDPQVLIEYSIPYKNENVAARLQLLCSNQICMQQLVATK